MRVIYTPEVVVFHKHGCENAHTNGIGVVGGGIIIVVGMRLSEQNTRHSLIGTVGEPVVMIGHLVPAGIGLLMFRSSAVQADQTVRIIRIGIKEFVP